MAPGSGAGAATRWDACVKISRTAVGPRVEAPDRGVHFCRLLRQANGLILKPAALRKLYPVKFLKMDPGFRRYDGIAGLSFDDFLS